MSAVPSPDFLGWHSQWLPQHARSRAAEAFLEMRGATDQDALDSNGLHVWERVGLVLAGDVFMGMDGLETAEFTERAQLAAIEIFLRRLHQLLSTTPMGGAA